MCGRLPEQVNTQHAGCLKKKKIQNTIKTKSADPYYQQRKCSPMISFWQYKVYADIRGGSLERGRQTTVG